MPLRRFLLRIVDPAGAAFEQDLHPRPVHRGAAVFGPGEPAGGRPPTAEEWAALEEAAAAHRGDHEARVEAALARWRPELEAAADRLRSGEPVDLSLGDRRVRARILWFWHGDSLLEVTAEGGTSSSRSRTRIPRDPRRLGNDVLVYYLVHAYADPE